LGQGGFATTYLARDQLLQRTVALKVAPHHHFTSEQHFETAANQARVLAGLLHPGIVPIYELGRMPNGQFYAVFEHIEGSSLADRLKRNRLPLGEAVDLVRQVAEAIGYAHRQGVIHGDIKPNNILLDDPGHAYLTDFGVAQIREDSLTASPLAGTPAFMSPEQVRGQHLDGRSDIFSLGVVFYLLLTGHRPFQGESSATTLEMLLAGQAATPRSLDAKTPNELSRICMKCLAVTPADRYATAEELAAELGNWQKGRSTKSASRSMELLSIPVRQIRKFFSPAKTPGAPPKTRVDWERLAMDLRDYRDTQKKAWGEIDEDTLSRYLANDVTEDERVRVEMAQVQHPDLKVLIELIKEMGPAMTLSRSINEPEDLEDDAYWERVPMTQEGWERLVKLYAPLVYNWCMKAHLQPADSEDIGQQVFETVFRKLPYVSLDRPGDTFAGWLRRITLHKIHALYRQGVRRPLTGSVQSLPLSTPDAEPSNEDQLNERTILLSQAVQMVQGEFSEKAWTAFHRVHIQGQPIADVAAEMKITPNAVSAAIRRVIARLRREFADVVGDYGMKPDDPVPDLPGSGEDAPAEEQ